MGFVRAGRTRFACLLLMPLLFQASLVTGRPEAPPTGPVVYVVHLPPGYYEYFPVLAFANSTVVHYSLTSDASVSTALMTEAQFQLFSDSNGPVSDSISHHDGTGVDTTVRVGPGYYVVLVYAYRDAASGTLSVSVSPNNPLSGGELEAPQPTGIASFGLTNQSDVDNPYSIASTDVIGLASIAAMGAYNASAGLFGANPSGVTLQLNSMLVVDQGGEGSQAYWCQNTPDFVTATSQLALADNVWNASASGYLSNDSITSQGGGGYVSTAQQNGTTVYFYAVTGSNSTYSLPIGLVLLMNATVEPGSGVLVQFGAKVIENSPGAGRGTDWFDNVTIHDSDARGAYFATDGNYSTPLGTFYDTELVFAGEGGGEATTFTSMSASLGLFYANGTSPAMTAFPSYFGFGQDTEEAAGNLRVSYLGGGEASVSVGAPDYAYLGAASGNFTLDSVEDSLGFPARGSATSTTSPGTTTTGAQSTTNAGGIPEFPLQVVAATALVTLIALCYLVVRRSGWPGAAKRL